ALQVSVALQRRVDVVNIRGMVLVVVDAHRLFVDVRLQRVIRIRQRWQFVSHSNILLSIVRIQDQRSWSGGLRRLFWEMVKAPCLWVRARGKLPVVPA